MHRARAALQVNRVKRTIEQSLASGPMTVQSADSQKVLDVMARSVNSTARHGDTEHVEHSMDDVAPKKHRRSLSAEMQGPSAKADAAGEPGESPQKAKAKAKPKAKATAKAEARRKQLQDQAKDLKKDLEEEVKRAAAVRSTLARGLQEEVQGSLECIEGISADLEDPRCDVKRAGAELKKCQARLKNHKKVELRA